MADDADPPRKFYQLKPKEFERVNPPVSATPVASLTPTAASSSPADAPIDVHELFRQGTAGAPLLGSNKVGNRTNEVHAVLNELHQHDQAAGLYHVAPTVDLKRRRRVRRFWILVVLVNAALGGFAWQVGPSAAIPFVCAIAGMGMLTAVLTWQTWFLRTD